MSWRKHRQPRAKRSRPVPTTPFGVTRYENFLAAHNPEYVIGIDEVAFGCFAGPLVVGGVVVPRGATLPVQDSKRYAKRAKLLAAEAIVREQATFVYIHEVPVEVLNEKGLGDSLQEAFAQVAKVTSAQYPNSVVVLDGKNLIRDFSSVPQIAIPKADSFVCAVSCASVCAKTVQLSCMNDLDELYPEYGFHKHHGYGTSEHRRVITQLGVTPAHRTYIGYIQKALAKTPNAEE